MDYLKLNPRASAKEKMLKKGLGKLEKKELEKPEKDIRSKLLFYYDNKELNSSIKMDFIFLSSMIITKLFLLGWIILQFFS